jgi:thiol:disulfide interchange protein DsbD
VRKYIICLVWFFMSITSVAVYAAGNAKPLSADQAFQLSVNFVRPNALMAEWRIAPGYYLYVKHTKLTFSPSEGVDVQYPKGESKFDEEHGQYEVYSGIVNIPVMLQENNSPTSVNIEYQGCSKNGFCYPPMSKSFMINATDLSVTAMSDLRNTPQPSPTLGSLLLNQNDVGNLLEHHRFGGMTILIFVGLGLLLAFTPCVLPMIPILTSIVVGQKHVPGTRKAFFLSLTYVLGMSVTYACAGMAAASLGGSLQVWLQKPVTIAIVSGLFVMLALSLFGLYELRFSRRWHSWIYAWSNKHEGGTYVGVFFMGVLATLVVSPCVTAPLVGVLIYIGQTGNLLFGATALFAMGIGMGIPLLLIGMSAGKWLPKSGPWMKAVKELFGIFMVAMAIWLLSRIIPNGVTLILFGALMLIFAGFVGIYLPKLVRMQSINRVFGLVSGLVGIFLVFNGMNTMIVTKDTMPRPQTFIVVNDLSQLNQQLSIAQAASQPVILDFYADWCASCVAMDKQVFASESVREKLSNFVLLRVDLSKNTKSDIALLKQFEVIAPPTVLFFNQAGKEVNSRRIVGELNKKEFITRINSFITASCDKKVQC